MDVVPVALPLSRPGLLAERWRRRRRRRRWRGRRLRRWRLRRRRWRIRLWRRRRRGGLWSRSRHRPGTRALRLSLSVTFRGARLPMLARDCPLHVRDRRRARSMLHARLLRLCRGAALHRGGRISHRDAAQERKRAERRIADLGPKLRRRRDQHALRDVALERRTPQVAGRHRSSDERRQPQGLRIEHAHSLQRASDGAVTRIRSARPRPGSCPCPWPRRARRPRPAKACRVTGRWRAPLRRSSL